jgi:hypothetical protein
METSETLENALFPRLYLVLVLTAAKKLATNPKTRVSAVHHFTINNLYHSTIALQGHIITALLKTLITSQNLYAILLLTPAALTKLHELPARRHQ